MDNRFSSLPVDIALEVSKLPKEMQSILANIVATVGYEKLSVDAVKSLKDIPPNETAVLMQLLKF
jgi:hypothetical protein